MKNDHLAKLVKIDRSRGPALQRPVRRLKNNAEGDWPECLCGNTPELQGFHACDKAGNLTVEPGGGPLDTWDGIHSCCGQCGIIFDQGSMLVKGQVLGSDDADFIAKELEAAVVALKNVKARLDKAQEPSREAFYQKGAKAGVDFEKLEKQLAKWAGGVRKAWCLPDDE